MIHKFKKFGWGFILLLFIVGRAWAVEPSVEVQVDSETVSMDDTLNLTILVKGGDAMTTPDIPALGHFDVVGRSTGTSVEIINGQMNSTKTFQYVLAPRAPGEFSIGPIKVFIEGKEYTAGPIRVKVRESAASGNYQPQIPPPIPQYPVPQNPAYPNLPWGNNPTEPPRTVGNHHEETFVTAETDKKEAYVGEQILYTFRLYTSVNVQEAQLDLPEFKDFINEELVKEKRYTVNLGNRQYAVNEWRLALFPTKAGEIETGLTQVKAKVPVRVGNQPIDDPFFGNYSVTLRSKTFSAPSITIKVKELPPAPSDFTGLVGDFSIASTLSKDSLNLGETANLKVEISGKGNIREANIPSLDTSNSFKVYPDKPEVKVEKISEGLMGKKIFNFALVAQRPGEATLPALNLSYFNPNAGTYEKLNTQAMTVQITGSSVSEKLVTAGIEPSKESTGLEAAKTFDIQPLKPPDMVLSKKILYTKSRALCYFLLLVSPVAFFCLLGIRRFQAKALAQADDRKRSRAFKKAKSYIAHLKPSDGKINFSEISIIIKAYLGDRYLVKGTAMTPVEVEAFLKSKRIPMEIVRHMTYLLEQFDQWKYGGLSQSLPREKELKQEILNLLREIEKSV